MKYKKLLTIQSFWIRILYIVSIAFLISLISLFILKALENGTHVNTYAANGTFQLYNPLRRLASGQVLGLDFPFFHGIGIPLLHFPVFSVLGSGLFAAEVAKWIVSPMMFLVSSFLFFLAYFKKLKLSIIALAIFSIMSLAWIDVIWPSNSLMGVRGTLPVLIAAALVWKTTKTIKVKKISLPVNECIALLLLGISLLFGTEHGVAAIAAYAIVSFIEIIIHKRDQFVRQILILALKGVLILIVAFLAYTLLTLGHPLTALHYAFIDVPQDQGWYFGAGPDYYLSVHTLLPSLFNIYTLPIWITVLLAVLLIIGYRIITKKTIMNSALWFMVAYGVIIFLITIWGYYSPVSQLIPLQRMLGLIIVAVALPLIFQQPAEKYIPNKNIRTAFAIVTLLATVILTATLCVSFISNLTWIKDRDARNTLYLASQARQKDDYFALSEGWKSAVDSFRPYIDPSKRIWSMYTGAYDSIFGNQLNPSIGGEDYIIHALGDARRAAYEQSFADTKPHYVISLKPEYFPLEEWLWINHWHIYEQLFTQYSLVARNGSHYLWERNDTVQVGEEKSLPAEVTPDSVKLPGNTTNNTIVYSVTVQYDAHGAIPLTDRLSRYLINIDSALKAQQYSVFLPSHKHEWTFPVIVLPGNKEVTLRSSTDGMFPATLIINSASFKEVNIPTGNLDPIEDNIRTFNSEKKL